MASQKKNKGKTVASKKADTRFVNDAALIRFDLVKDKSVIYERGFQIEIRGWSMTYIEHIRQQGWDSFCHPRTEAILQWVHEFYANPTTIRTRFF